jgi:hypothetical protein
MDGWYLFIARRSADRLLGYVRVAAIVRLTANDLVSQDYRATDISQLWTVDRLVVAALRSHDVPVI